MSHPTWVRGLKHTTHLRLKTMCQSHPTWVRGLKQKNLFLKIQLTESHSTWVRGLKLESIFVNSVRVAVAPYVGAWIETAPANRCLQNTACRTLRGCVD